MLKQSLLKLLSRDISEPIIQKTNYDKLAYHLVNSATSTFETPENKLEASKFIYDILQG